MRSQDTLALLSKHRQLIIVAIGVAALVSYMVPLGNLFAVADASGDWFKKTKDKTPDKKFTKLKFKHLFGKIFKISDSFNKIFGVGELEINNKVRGGDINNIAYTGADGGLNLGGATAVNFGSTYTIVQNNVQVCVLVTTCANAGNTVSISTSISNQYSNFGGSI
jgi:hypothetical protein